MLTLVKLILLLCVRFKLSEQSAITANDTSNITEFSFEPYRQCFYAGDIIDCLHTETVSSLDKAIDDSATWHLGEYVTLQRNPDFVHDERSLGRGVADGVMAKFYDVLKSRRLQLQSDLMPLEEGKICCKMLLSHFVHALHKMSTRVEFPLTKTSSSVGNCHCLSQTNCHIIYVFDCQSSFLSCEHEALIMFWVYVYYSSGWNFDAVQQGYASSSSSQWLCYSLLNTIYSTDRSRIYTLEIMILKINAGEEYLTLCSPTIFRSKEEKQTRWNVYVQWASAGRPAGAAGTRQGSFCCSRCTYSGKDCAVRVDHGNVGTDLLKV